MTTASIPQLTVREKRANAPPGMAYCSKCDSYAEFRADWKMPGGLSYMCKSCASTHYPRRKPPSKRRRSPALAKESA